MKVKNYTIKVPVYTTEIIENPNDMFGGVSYEDMIKFIKTKIDFFNSNTKELSFDNRNKTKKTVIDKISFNDIESKKGLLVQISAYTTNHYDGYFEAEEKINFEKNYKLGSETNFILIYPIIKGLTKDSYTHHYIILIYEDPTKNHDEITKLTKNVLNKILQIPIANVKLPTIMEELRQIKVIPELKVKYSAIYYNDNDVDIKYREYLIDGKFKKEKEDHFKNMPFEKVEELINEKNEDDFQKKETKVIVGKKEYKISKELMNEAKETLKEAGEKIFNASTSITQEELDVKIHNNEFIISKLTPILENYLSTNND